MRRRSMLPALAAALALSPWSVRAADPPPVELAGVRYDAFETVAGSRLQLNGAGIRYKAIFKVYTAGLYLGRPATTPEAVYTTPGPRRLHIVMLREIDANELGKLFTQGMEKNASRQEFAKSIPGTLKLAELFARKKKLAAGDSFSVDFLPGQGTVVVVNGKPEIEPIKEPEFFNVLMSIWLGQAPADAGLKDALLGLKGRAFGA
ncbi:chalcone isomerase family protein [Ideonella sp. 4Y11]|uniref:Chalcone isomerase family protein n=1 Tax=Ideonella aquatica TaxID=2824119 RepID=A0A940YM90_9BURK|nr:chalcone isomerase family protein [Ideonella aquatica]MBQ0960531.1 chalcone isomerase family protein [Ideonella aquatica]